MSRLVIVITVLLPFALGACSDSKEEDAETSKPDEDEDFIVSGKDEDTQSTDIFTAPQPDINIDANVQAPSDELDIQADAGSDSTTPDAQSQCSDEGSIRCMSVSSKLRQRCTSGGWVSIDPCPDGQVCDSEDEDEPGSCRDIFKLCIGFGGSSVCDKETMHTCSIDGIDRTQETCDGPRHCQVGVFEGKCATCLPGDFRCVDERLERCANSGHEWELYDTCSTDALCNDIIGDCTNEICRPDTYFCESDVLMGCNDEQTALIPVEVCEDDLCDEFGKQCDICIPGERLCDGDVALTCVADGQSYRSRECESGQCDSGRCQQCQEDDDCEESENSCEKVTCNAFGECVYESICDDDTPFCEEDGCVACLQDSHCSVPLSYRLITDDECVEAQCVEGECEVVYNETTERCGWLNAFYCDGSGQCVECNKSKDCNQSGYVCEDNQCIRRECIEDDDCEEGLECREYECLPPESYCGDGKLAADEEECDPFEERPEIGVYYTDDDENTLFCDEQCQIHTLYTPCSNNLDCIGDNGTCFGTFHLCSVTCSPNNNTCPSIPTDAEPKCTEQLVGPSLCALICDEDEDCPPDVHCVEIGGIDGKVCQFETDDED